MDERLVRIDFGIEYDRVKKEGLVGALYQGMRGIERKLSFFDSIVILDKESKKKVEKYNSQKNENWTIEPRIPNKFLFLTTHSFMLRNE